MLWEEKQFNIPATSPELLEEASTIPFCKKFLDTLMVHSGPIS